MHSPMCMNEKGISRHTFRAGTAKGSKGGIFINEGHYFLDERQEERYFFNKRVPWCSALLTLSGENSGIILYFFSSLSLYKWSWIPISYFNFVGKRTDCSIRTRCKALVIYHQFKRCIEEMKFDPNVNTIFVYFMYSYMHTWYLYFWLYEIFIKSIQCNLDDLKFLLFQKMSS